MSGLCGWFGAGARVEHGLTAIAAMGGALTASTEEDIAAEASSEQGLAARGKAADLSVEDSLWVSIEGHPQWSDPELAKFAASRGHGAALARAYRDRGRDLFAVLHGPASIAVLDIAHRRAVVAIDRLGVRPICYATPAKGGLVFGTNADCVRAHPAVPATISNQALFDYLFFARVPAPTTIYEEQRKLLPGQFLWFEDGAATVDWYWQMPYRDEGAINFDALSAEFREIMDRGMGRILAESEDAAIGAFLSGGLDSTTVLGVLAGQSSSPASAFSIGFDAEGFDEMRYARLASHHFGAKQHEYYATPEDILAVAPVIAETYDEPFGNASAVPVYLCARLAKENGVDILLAGDGGDEIFAGNERYGRQKIYAAYEKIPLALRRGAIEPLAGIGAEWDPMPLRKLRSYLRRAKMPMPDRLESDNFFLDADLARVCFPEVLEGVDPHHPLETMRDVYSRAPSASMVNRMLFLDLHGTLADDDLRKVCRMSERAGVDVRYPMLDEELAEFAARLPPRLKLKRLVLRYFFKRALRDFLPRQTITKSKHGFGLPFGQWLMEHKMLQEMFHDSMASLGHRALFQPAFLDEIVGLQRDGRGHPGYHGPLMWVLMMLELWLQSHADGFCVADGRIARRGKMKETAR